MPFSSFERVPRQKSIILSIDVILLFWSNKQHKLVILLLIQDSRFSMSDIEMSVINVGIIVLRKVVYDEFDLTTNNKYTLNLITKHIIASTKTNVTILVTEGKSLKSLQASQNSHNHMFNNITVFYYNKVSLSIQQCKSSFKRILQSLYSKDQYSRRILPRKLVLVTMTQMGKTQIQQNNIKKKKTIQSDAFQEQTIFYIYCQNLGASIQDNSAYRMLNK